MPNPKGTPPAGLTERPVLVRPRAWVGMAIIAGAAVWGLAGFAAQGDVEPADWEVGSCVTGGQFLALVPCSSDHTGELVAFREAWADCPADTEDFIDAPHGGGFCIDGDH